MQYFYRRTIGFRVDQDRHEHCRLARMAGCPIDVARMIAESRRLIFGHDSLDKPHDQRQPRGVAGPVDGQTLRDSWYP